MAAGKSEFDKKTPGRYYDLSIGRIDSSYRYKKNPPGIALAGFYIHLAYLGQSAAIGGG
jgi:hypothetical protein